MRYTSSDNDRDTPCPIFWFAVAGQATLITRLAAGAREDGGQIGRLARAHALEWRPASFGKGSPLCHLNLFHVGLSHAVAGVTPTCGSHEELFLAQYKGRAGGGGGRPGCLDYGVSARRTWCSWHTTLGTHQHDIVE